MNPSSRNPEWLYVGLAALPLLYLAAIWSQLPDTIPVHFNASGQPDGYSSKQSFAVVLTITLFAIYGLFRILPAIDPTKRLYSMGYDRARLVMGLSLSGIFSVMLYVTHTGKTGDIAMNMIILSVYILLIAVGNILLTVPQNYFIGIKTPWALASEANWRKTHRMAGKLWVVGGATAFLINFFLPTEAKVVVAVSVAMLLAFIPYLYSYRLFKQGLAVFLLVVGTHLNALAQTEELLRYAITQPFGANLTLEGTLTLPANVPDRMPVVMLIAGSGPNDRDGNSAIPAMGKINVLRQLSDSLVRRGIAVLRYDKRGSGANRAAFFASNLHEQPMEFNYYVDDAVGFVRQLQADKRFSKVVIAGHSEGSLVGMLAAQRTGVQGFVSLAGAGQPIGEVMKQQNRDSGAPPAMIETAIKGLDSLQAGQLVHHPLMLASLPLSQQPFVISWMKHDPAAILKTVRAPILIIQGQRDMQVATSEAERLKAARPDATYRLFPTMTHVLKEGPAERLANFASYTVPGAGILPGVVEAIATFAVRL